MVLNLLTVIYFKVEVGMAGLILMSGGRGKLAMRLLSRVIFWVSGSSHESQYSFYKRVVVGRSTSLTTDSFRQKMARMHAPIFVSPLSGHYVMTRPTLEPHVPPFNNSAAYNCVVRRPNCPPLFSVVSFVLLFYTSTFASRAQVCA